ncbi:MAG TPA: molybdate ABC transporter substrate-binding protein [Casimicrobiaceae bacterium]|nr:molybdate ABC transporter substrate-binding protein [Casimicrobiaceae bacterium]
MPGLRFTAAEVRRLEGRPGSALRRTVVWLLVLGPLAGAAHAQKVGGDGAGPLIAAASDLRFALDELAASFRRDGGGPVRIVYGSSGNFRRQIAEGAPFELFLSADESYVRALEREGRLADGGVLYGIGRLALVVPPGSSLAVDGSLAGVAAAARDGRIRRFAIANPEHAPYGRAAQEALTAVGAWVTLRPRLVLGENVAQAMQFATSGSTDGGIVALSLALAPGALGTATYAAVPEALHRPLAQRMALTRRASPEARAFYEHLQRPASRQVLKRYGFALPGE